MEFVWPVRGNIYTTVSLYCAKKWGKKYTSIDVRGSVKVEATFYVYNDTVYLSDIKEFKV